LSNVIQKIPNVIQKFSNVIQKIPNVFQKFSNVNFRKFSRQKWLHDPLYSHGIFTDKKKIIITGDNASMPQVIVL